MGSKSSAYSPQTVRSWCVAPQTGLYARLTNHCLRVQRDVRAVLGRDDVRLEDCAPAILAFTGKKNWADIRGVSTSKVAFGYQRERPPGWPACLAKAEVVVLTSSSGAAALSWEDRLAPYRELAERTNSGAMPRFPSWRLLHSDPALYRAGVAEAWAVRVGAPGGPSRDVAGSPVTPAKREEGSAL